MLNIRNVLHVGRYSLRTHTTYSPVASSFLHRVYIILSRFRHALSVSAVSNSYVRASSQLMINPFEFSSSLLFCAEVVSIFSSHHNVARNAAAILHRIVIACSDSWSLSHLGYLYPGTVPVMIKLDHNRSCPWV